MKILNKILFSVLFSGTSFLSAQQSRLIEFSDSLTELPEIATVYLHDSSIVTLLFNKGNGTIVLKSDMNYNLLWQKKINNIGISKAIASAADRIFFVGKYSPYLSADTINGDPTFGMMDTSGNILWAKHINNIKDSTNTTISDLLSFRSILKLANDRFAITLNKLFYFSPSIIMICDSTGAVIKMKCGFDSEYMDLLDYNNDTLRATMTADYIMVGGVTIIKTDSLLNFSPNGFLINAGFYSQGTGYHKPRVIKSATGQIFETAIGVSSFGAPEGYVRKYDSIGNLIWSARNPVIFNLPDVNFNGQIGLDSKDNFFFNSQNNDSPSGKRSSLISFDSSGTFLHQPFWHSRYDADHNCGIAINKSDSVFCLKSYGKNKLNILNLGTSLNYSCSEADTRTFASSITGTQFVATPYFSDSISYTITNCIGLISVAISHTETNYCGITTDISYIAESDLNIYPNPSSDYIILSGTENLSQPEIKIFSYEGKLLLSQKLNKANASIPIKTKLQDGLFIYKIFDAEKVIKTGKLVVRN